MKVLYLPVARLTFDVNLAEQMFKESKQALVNLPGIELSAPDELLSDPVKLDNFISQAGQHWDAVVFQDITFVDGQFISQTIDLVNAPVIIWGLREDLENGGRLRLNTLTGVMSTANTLMVNHRQYCCLIGNPDEDQTVIKLKSLLKVVAVYRRLHGMHLGVVGKYPAGFYFSDADNQLIHDTFGVSLFQYELADWLKQAETVSTQAYQKEMDFAKERVVGLNPADETVKRFAQFTAVAKHYIQEDHLSSLAMRCWPDFFTALHAAPCGIFSQLTDQQFPTACEHDIHGSLSMFILQELTTSAPYLGDIVNCFPERNEIVMWHCGFAAFSLANKRTRARAGVHPNRKIGLAMDFGLKPGKVTLLRVNFTGDGYRLITLSGTVLDRANAYQGTSAQIKLDCDAEAFLKTAIAQGYEPHFALAYGDVVKEVAELGSLLQLPVIQY
ncbi:hypothetical protein [Limosilactobacillus difficilis]|uniref:hypothetical protein n=1 Tax=Limosilactobacillus difficilis TaxID=2991838 RepID=UPI0024B942E9|nr:hypothetical protein [Limosilactobacillus difficilis]